MKNVVQLSLTAEKRSGLFTGQYNIAYFFHDCSQDARSNINIAISIWYRLIYRLGFRERIIDAFICLHWLRVPQHIEFKLAVWLTNFSFNQATCYLGPLVRVADLSAHTDRLLVPVAAPRVWNVLPNTVTSAQSHSFRHHMETYRFQLSFPDIIVTPEWTL